MTFLKKDSMFLGKCTEKREKRSLPERMRSSIISASPRNAAAWRGVRFSESWKEEAEKKRIHIILDIILNCTNHYKTKTFPCFVHLFLTLVHNYLKWSWLSCDLNSNNQNKAGFKSDSCFWFCFGHSFTTEHRWIQYQLGIFACNRKYFVFTDLTYHFFISWCVTTKHVNFCNICKNVER